MKNMVALILGGGKGTRLQPLTSERSKPAVPLAAKYRLIDIPISNCLNSQINRIYLLTQFNSVSLHRHIRQTYKFDRFSAGFVEILAAQQTVEGANWYQGTADAVRKNLRYIEQYGIDYVLILSGDQLYRMDYEAMLKTHIESEADVTISALPVTDEAARGFGIMQLDDNGRVRGFTEKPQTTEEMDPVRMTEEWIDARGIESKGRTCLASMGIYLFNRDTLVNLLNSTTYEDFGKEVFPQAIDTHRVQVHLFDGYWEDIGTIKSFYDANLALANENPPFDFSDEESPIYSRARYLPPTSLYGATIKNSLIADGCTVGSGTLIENSVIGLRCKIGENVTIRDSILMGADFYETAQQIAADKAANRPTVGIASGATIVGTIVDKNCCIGKNANIVPTGDSGDAETHDEQVTIRDGIVIVKRGSTLPDGWSI